MKPGQPPIQLTSRRGTDLAVIWSDLGRFGPSLEQAKVALRQGRHADAKAAYQEFLSGWRDADAGIPVLQSAKAEAAKL
jgi:hypothetical protein